MLLSVCQISNSIVDSCSDANSCSEVIMRAGTYWGIAKPTFFCYPWLQKSMLHAKLYDCHTIWISTNEDMLMDLCVWGSTKEWCDDRVSAMLTFFCSRKAYPQFSEQRKQLTGPYYTTPEWICNRENQKTRLPKHTRSIRQGNRDDPTTPLLTESAIGNTKRHNDPSTQQQSILQPSKKVRTKHTTTIIC